LTLPFFIKKINLFRDDDNQSEDEIYLHLHKKLNRESAHYIHDHYAEELEFHPTLQQLALSWKDPDEVLLDGGHLNTDGKLIMLEVINKQREWLREWNKHQELDEEFIKKHLYRLDLEEERLKY
jgi:CPA1 family monovalent cation:H+ antiporter